MKFYRDALGLTLKFELPGWSEFVTGETTLALSVCTRLPTRIWPEIELGFTVKYAETPPEAYPRQELEELFRVSDENEKFLWRFFLGTGFRESEVSVAEVTDVNRDTKTILVDEKPHFGFKPKDYEKRSVPIPDALIAENWRMREVRLVFPGFRKQQPAEWSPSACAQACGLRRRHQLRQMQGNRGRQGSLLPRSPGLREVDSAPVSEELRERSPQWRRKCSQDTEVVRPLSP